MIEDHLTKELLRRIFGNVGAVAGPNFGKVGITTEDHIIGKTIDIINDSNKKERYPIYSGKIEAGDKFNIALANLGSLSVPEFIMVMAHGESTEKVFGFRLHYGDNDPGTFMIHLDSKWIGISVLYKLNLTTAFEVITQEGLLWTPNAEFATENLYEPLAGMVEHLDSQ